MPLAAIAQPQFPDHVASDGYVVDYANIIPDAEEARLEAEVLAFEKKTGAEVAVVTINSTNGVVFEEYAHGLFRHWGIGKKGVDNGILFLYVKDENKRRIEVGRRLEGFFTDALAKSILVETRPYFRGGDTGVGMAVITRKILATLDANLAAEGLVTPKKPVQEPEEGVAGAFIVFVIFAVAVVGIICFVVWSIQRSRRTVYSDPLIRTYEPDARYRRTIDDYEPRHRPSRADDYGSRRRSRADDDFLTGASAGAVIGSSHHTPSYSPPPSPPPSPDFGTFGGGDSAGGGASD